MRVLCFSFVLLLPLFTSCTNDNPVIPVVTPEFHGTFTVRAVGSPTAGVGGEAFAHLLEVPIEFIVSFSSVQDVVRRHRGGFNNLEFTTDAANFRFIGDPTSYLEETVAANMNGTPQTLMLIGMGREEILIDGAFNGPYEGEHFGLSLFVYSDGFFDAEGFPALEDFSAEGAFTLSRGTRDQTTTDVATGDITISLRGASGL